MFQVIHQKTIVPEKLFLATIKVMQKLKNKDFSAFKDINHK